MAMLFAIPLCYTTATLQDFPALILDIYELQPAVELCTRFLNILDGAVDTLFKHDKSTLPVTL